MKLTIKAPGYETKCTAWQWLKWQAWRLKFSTVGRARMWLRLHRPMISPRCMRCRFWSSDPHPLGATKFLHRRNNPYIGRSQRTNAKNLELFTLIHPTAATMDVVGEIHLVTHSHFGCVNFQRGVHLQHTTAAWDR